MTTHIKTVQSVAKAIQLLDCFSQSGEPLSLSELSDMTGWAKSTIHGLLYTLRLQGIVMQLEHSGKYWLGDKVLELGRTKETYGDIKE